MLLSDLVKDGTLRMLGPRYPLPGFAVRAGGRASIACAA
jgi:hypothetical protein